MTEEELGRLEALAKSVGQEYSLIGIKVTEILSLIALAKPGVL